MQPVARRMNPGKRFGIRACQNQRGHFGSRQPPWRAGSVQEEAASFIKHVREHQKGDQTEDKIGLKLMTSPVSFGPDHGPPQNGPEARAEYNQFKQVLETIVKNPEACLHKGAKNGYVHPLGHQVNGTEPQDHEPPEYHDMNHARPQIAGLAFLNNCVDKEAQNPLRERGKTGIGLSRTNQDRSLVDDI